MCGTLHDLSSVDGQIWKSHLKDIESVSNNHSRRRKHVSTIDEVKLNLSGWWTMEDVWGTSGWELNKKLVGLRNNASANALSWDTYKPSSHDDHDSFFLQHLSQLHWSVQWKFKDIFDKYLRTAHKKVSNEAFLQSSPASIESSKRVSLPQSIGLKQLGRSIKYMTAAEKREQQKQKGKNSSRFTHR